MPTRVWKFELRGKRHSVVLEHTHWTGRRTITVDGAIIYTSKAPLDFHAEDWFNIDSIPCTIRIRGSEVGDYRLFVEGDIIEPASERKERVEMESEKHLPNKEEPSPVTFDSLDSFKELIREHYNLAQSKLEGTIEPDTLISILKEIEDKVSLYWRKTKAFAHNSALEILVFPANQFGPNIRFLGLATFYPGMLSKLCQEYHLSTEEIGLVNDQVMSRFGFSMFHDNSQSKEWVENHYQLVSISELDRVINARKAELGLH